MFKPLKITNSLLIAATLTVGMPMLGTTAFASGGGGGGGGAGSGSFGGSEAPRYDPVVEYQKGTEALRTEDYKTASRAFARVLKTARKDANTNYNMGLAQAGLEKHKKAGKYFKAAAKYNPDMLQAYPAAAKSYMAAGKNDNAQDIMTMLDKQIQKCGETCATATALNETKAVVENVLNGVDVQKQSFLRPDVRLAKAEGVQYFGAVALINQNRYDEAIEQLVVLAGDVGPHPDVMNYLGYSHRKLGQYDRAEYFYGVALSVDDNHKGANEYLGELYVETGQFKKAHIQLQKLESICSFGCVEEDELREWITAAAW